jgi:AMP nucleosidase
MIPEGVKSEASDQLVTKHFVEKHIVIGIEALNELINEGTSVRHLRFE